MSEATPGPWAIKDNMDDRGRGYLEIRGPNDEAVLTMFPLAGNGGVGVDSARENASMIVHLVNASRET